MNLCLVGACGQTFRAVTTKITELTFHNVPPKTRKL